MGAPGSDVDDGFALALALADPDITVELVSTVNGNTDVHTATTLTAELLERLGRADIPLARGAGAPLRPDRAVRSSPAIGDEAWVGRRHAACEIAERVAAAPGELTVVAIGPLTNIALALLLRPEMAGELREIVIMGGVYLGHTNLATMPGEFNFWVDPDAAAVVLASGGRIRCVGLDVTQQVRLTMEDAERLESSGGKFGEFAGASAREWIRHCAKTLPGAAAEHASCAMHDPLAVAVVTSPDLVAWTPAHVAVETDSRLARGVAVADLLASANPPAPNCLVATSVDADGFRGLFLDRLSTL
jgi:purine nucleosidase